MLSTAPQVGNTSWRLVLVESGFFEGTRMTGPDASDMGQQGFLRDMSLDV